MAPPVEGRDFQRIEPAQIDRRAQVQKTALGEAKKGLIDALILAADMAHHYATAPGLGASDRVHWALEADALFECASSVDPVLCAARMLDVEGVRHAG
jgi:hypothetical protein